MSKRLSTSSINKYKNYESEENILLWSPGSRIKLKIEIQEVPKLMKYGIFNRHFRKNKRFAKKTHMKNENDAYCRDVNRTNVKYQDVSIFVSA